MHIHVYGTTKLYVYIQVLKITYIRYARLPYPQSKLVAGVGGVVGKSSKWHLVGTDCSSIRGSSWMVLQCIPVQREH